MSSGPERRLHPLSLLFDITKYVKELVIPLVVVMFASRSDGGLRLLLGGAILTAAVVQAVSKFLTYRYRYDADDLVVRSGVFVENERHIPYNRIQNIDAVQNVVHRMFGVAVVQVQTGSGKEPEATMRVLPLDALAEMRARVFAERAAAAPVEGSEAAELVKPPPRRLLHLPARELVIAGFIENRGMALIIATIGVLWQFDPLEKLMIDRIARWTVEHADDTPTVDPAAFGGVTTVILGGTALFLGMLLFVRALSTVWAMIRLHDFTLVRDGDDLRAEYGLFTRVTATIPVRRVQTISVHERLLHRRFGRVAVRVTTAGGGGVSGDEAGGSVEREWLAPIIRRDRLPELLRELDPTLDLDSVTWRRADPRAVWRILRLSSVWIAVFTAGAAFLVGWWAAAVGALLALRATLRARGIVRNLGCGFAGDRVVFRSGWLHLVTTVARFERVQASTLLEGFFDRRANMATIAADTAGLGASDLRMHYLPRAEAVDVHARLSASVLRTPFVW